VSQSISSNALLQQMAISLIIMHSLDIVIQQHSMPFNEMHQEYAQHLAATCTFSFFVMQHFLTGTTSSRIMGVTSSGFVGSATGSFTGAFNGSLSSSLADMYILPKYIFWEIDE
jgi:LytS/YehU family sensor histidine kinase